ncbi:MAG TPA: helix-turn-helix domain-containing protein [Candidatus Thermoplasmatota archaeon]|nr:helix-turn-helix domain-containing protein [Candidatus Thermoplasmatota archaeon]
MLAVLPPAAAQLEPGPPGTITVSTSPAIDTPLLKTPGVRIAQDASIPALIIPEPVYGPVAGLRVDHPPFVQFWLTYHGWNINVLDLWFSNNYSNEYLQNGNRFTVAGWQSFDGETHWHSRWAIEIAARVQEYHTGTRGAPNMTPYWHPIAYRVHDETPNIHYSVHAREAGVAVNDFVPVVESEHAPLRAITPARASDSHAAGNLESAVQPLEAAALAPAPAPPRPADAPLEATPVPKEEATIASFADPASILSSPTALALVAAGAIVVGWLVGLLASSRLVRHRILQQRTRAAIFEAIDGRPGLTLAELVPIVGVRRQTVAYHLRVLVQQKYVVTRRWGERTLHFASDASEAREPFTRVVVGRADRARQILETVRAEPGITSTRLTERLGLGRSTVRWHLSRLEALRLIETRRAGGVIELRAAGVR